MGYDIQHRDLQGGGEVANIQCIALGFLLHLSLVWWERGGIWWPRAPLSGWLGERLGWLGVCTSLPSVFVVWSNPGHFRFSLFQHCVIVLTTPLLPSSPPLPPTVESSVIDCRSSGQLRSEPFLPFFSAFMSAHPSLGLVFGNCHPFLWLKVFLLPCWGGTPFRLLPDPRKRESVLASSGGPGSCSLLTYWMTAFGILWALSSADVTLFTKILVSCPWAEPLGTATGPSTSHGTIDGSLWPRPSFSFVEPCDKGFLTQHPILTREARGTIYSFSAEVLWEPDCFPPNMLDTPQKNHIVFFWHRNVKLGEKNLRGRRI